jgi:hypothetical protein
MTEKGGYASMFYQHIESERQLTIHTCSGTILKQEVIDVLKVIYSSEPTPNHLWDLTGADFSQINGDDMQEIAEFVKQNAPREIYGRIALVSASSLAFGLARMFEALTDHAGLPVKMNVFRSLEEAEEWVSAVSDEDEAKQLFQPY